MSVSLVVPYQPEHWTRERNWQWLRERYERLYPDWEIVLGTCEGTWRKGVAVNSAVERAGGDVVIVIDADVLLGEQVLPEAVTALQKAAWVVPHSMVWRLSELATQAVIEGTLKAHMGQLLRQRLQRRQHSGPLGGGAVVTRRADFVGIDERFTEWGGEDISLGWALDTLVGPHLQLSDFMWHLYHMPMKRRMDNRASKENEILAGSYRRANGDPVAMHELCVERPSVDPTWGGGIVVSHRHTLQEVPLDERFEGWGHEDQSWAVALGTLAGQPEKVSGDLVHLHHPPQERVSRARGSLQNRKLRNRYAQARANPQRMEELISECRF